MAGNYPRGAADAMFDAHWCPTVSNRSGRSVTLVDTPSDANSRRRRSLFSRSRSKPSQTRFSLETAVLSDKSCVFLHLVMSPFAKTWRGNLDCRAARAGGE